MLSAARRVWIALLLAGCLLLTATGCSSRKFLGEGEQRLSDVRLRSTDKHIKPSDYRGFLRQEPNTKWFNVLPVPLGIYCLSKRDSVRGNKGFSRILRNIGQAPVIYSSSLTHASARNIEQALRSEGYLHAVVDTCTRIKGHKRHVTYTLTPGPLYYVNSLSRTFDSDSMAHAFSLDAAQSKLHLGMPLNLNVMSAERDRIVAALHDRGYYALHKDFVKFTIDTVPGSLQAHVAQHMAMPAGVDSTRAYRRQFFREVSLYEDVAEGQTASDSLRYRGIVFCFNRKLHVKKSTYSQHLGMAHDSLYRERSIQSTYGQLNSLPSINYTALRLQPVPSAPDSMDCAIHIKRRMPHSIGLEVEGTNTAGDFGVATALTYTNRNIFGGSEQLSLKARGAYEAITGLEGYANQNYIEWSGEATLRFPSLLVPRLKLSTRRLLRGASEAHFMYDSQDRPEFHRRVLTGDWTYKWHHTLKPRWQHKFDLFSLNYVYMPWISDTFRNEYLEGDDPHYQVLRYSYENLFIMKMGYSFTFNSRRNAQGTQVQLHQSNGYQVKFGVEIAGNLLYGFSKMLGRKRDDKGYYNLFGIAYSQYAKIDVDYVKSFMLNETNFLAFHAALGFGLPYGNSTILPYEKRYFAGGANSVRGWSVRELGPGSYKGKDGNVDFINQTGNLKLDLSVEWRTFLFWKLHGALFIDAGNVWNTRRYTGLEDGYFKWNRFYKQIAVAYGMGIRLNFDYFILRLDGGMKAVNPATLSGAAHYPIIHPQFKRDFQLHFAVGLPF